MLHSLLVGVGGLVLLMAFWVGVQQFVRRHSPPVGTECDLLEGMAHGCHGCHQGDTCGAGGVEKKPPSRSS